MDDLLAEVSVSKYEQLIFSKFIQNNVLLGKYILINQLLKLKHYQPYSKSKLS